MVLTFHRSEFLFLRKLDNDPQFWDLLKQSVWKENDNSLKVISPSFLAASTAETKDRFPSFIKKAIRKDYPHALFSSDLLSRYLKHHDFVEMHLDNIFKYGDDTTLPKDLFRCPNLKVLSLKYNFLDDIPPDIAKLQKLEYLALTNNKLKNSSIPYSLSFCRSLKVLLLDNNLLDALPGFLPIMTNLSTVHRHGNNNYFIWYHTDINDRILPVSGSTPKKPELASLKYLSATVVIASKVNFFVSCVVPQVITDYLCFIYSEFYPCYKCFTANLMSEPGYKVFTFKNHYLGNMCVPFQHWACSMHCAKAIEVPAHFEQKLANIEQDQRYNRCVEEAQNSSKHNKNFSLINLSCSIL